MILSAKLIRRPRKNRQCTVCDRMIGCNPLIQLYGAAERDDKPYPLWLHITCAQAWTGSDPKITAALGRYTADAEKTEEETEEKTEETEETEEMEH